MFTRLFTRHKDAAPRREREKLTSIGLLARGDVAGDKLAATWVDVAPGGRQIPHDHPEVQLYIIVAGGGRMRIGDEAKDVTAGELIHVPSGVKHGIENTGADVLSYVTAATPAFDYSEAYDRGQLQSGAYPR
jgi:mannose-6-phosphate isomerase-like protein (cupin superfamily)